MLSHNLKEGNSLFHLSYIELSWRCQGARFTVSSIEESKEGGVEEDLMRLFGVLVWMMLTPPLFLFNFGVVSIIVESIVFLLKVRKTYG